MTHDPEKRSAPTLHFAGRRLIIGPKVWLGLAVATVIVVIGVTNYPKDPTTGILVGVSGVLGAILGALFQTEPAPVDHSPQAVRAMRDLIALAQSIEKLQTVATGAAQLPSNTQVKLAMVSIQDKLGETAKALYDATAEWENIAPGAVAEVQALESAGSDALARWSKGTENE